MEDFFIELVGADGETFAARVKDIASFRDTKEGCVILYRGKELILLTPYTIVKDALIDTYFEPLVEHMNGQLSRYLCSVGYHYLNIPHEERMKWQEFTAAVLANELTRMADEWVAKYR